jgi:flagellar basal-body rod modification protein FlgD
MVSGVGSSSSSNGSNALTSALAATTSNNQFVSQNTFLTLLITQLQNQDPMNPQDSSQFVAQLAQFSSLEQMTQLNTSFNSVLDNSAAGMIGQTVTVADQNAQSGFATGQVTGVVYFANGPAVQVNGVNYPLSAIQNVGTVTPNAPTGG